MASAAASAPVGLPAPRDEPRPFRVALVATLALAAVAAAWLFTAGSSNTRAAAPSPAARAAFEEATGVRVIRVALTGGGGLVDLRYQVIDPDKAGLVHLDVPKLVDERTGEVVDALFMGHAHGGEPRAGYSYPLLFVNEQGTLERGGSVSIVIGDSRLEHVAVR